MTYEEAKMQIQAIPEKIWDQLSEPDREAMEMAISALQAQDSPKPKAESVQNVQNEDLISRKAAIDVLATMQGLCTSKAALVQNSKIWQQIKDLPSAQPESQWIPVSERPPEEDDYKSCIECLDGAVWYFTENGTMGLGYYYKSTKEWSTTDDLKTDGKVVAWKSLPGPYRAERRTDD